MAPKGTEWTALSRLTPDQVDQLVDEIPDQVDSYGNQFIKLRANDFDDLDDLKLALKLGQTFLRICREQRDQADMAAADAIRENEMHKSATIGAAKSSNKLVQSEFDRYEEEIQNYRREYEELQGRIKEKNEDHQRDLKRIQDFQQKNEGLEGAIDDLRRQLKELRDGRRTGEETTQRSSRLRQVERELNQILEENNQIAAENQNLTKSSEELKLKLAEATKNINVLTDEYHKLNENSRKKDEEILDLKNEINLLNDRISSFSEDNDDAIFKLVEERVKKVMDLFQEKDEEIDRLKEEVVYLKERLQRKTFEVGNENVSDLQRKLKQKDEEIKVYRKKLEQATEIINEKTDRLNNVVESSRAPSDPTSIATRSKEYELIRLKKQIEDYEKETENLQNKIKELQDENRTFLDGNFQLTDAVANIRQLKEKLREKDKDISDIASYATKVENESKEVNEENEELRAKLGMEPRKPMSKEELEEAYTSRTHANQAVVQVLQKEIEGLEEDRLKLKRLCRDLARQAGLKAGEHGFDGIAIDDDPNESSFRISRFRKNDDTNRPADFDEQIKSRDLEIDRLGRQLKEKNEQNRTLLMEIEGLEQGLKEIDQQLKQTRPGKSSSGEVQIIKCPSLDRLLQVLETQSAIGRYDGSIIVKSESDKMAGRLAELRDELYNVRHDKTRIEVDLRVATSQVEKLQRELKLFEDAGAVPLNYQQMKLPQGLSPSSRDIITALNEYLIDALAEVTAQRDINQKLEEGIEKYRRKLNVIKHQTGLLYKDFHEKQQQWLSERQENGQIKHQLQTEIDKNLVKLQEFDRLLNTLEQDDAEVRRRVAEATRKITVLRVNEKSLSRKIIAYQDIESHLRKDNTKLRSEVVDMEVTVQNRLNYLQRFKDTAAYRIKHLQKQVEQSVHQAELDKVNRRYEEIAEKYRDLLENQQNFIQQTERSSILTEENQKLNDEVDFLKRQLEIDKEKLHVLEETFEKLKNEGLINAGYKSSSARPTTSYSSFDDSAASLARRITVLEMKELNERQRAEYAQKLYDQQRKTLREMEDRNLALENKFRDLTKMNLEMQRTERQLRDDLVHSVPRTVSDADKKRISDLEAVEIHSKQEIARLREVADVASFQVSAINDMKMLDEKEFQSLRQQLVDLQSKSDDKTEIGKLHRHVLALQISEATIKRKLMLAENDLNKQKALLLRTEQKLDEKEQSLFYIRQEYTQRIRYLRTALQDYRNKFAGALPLNVQENYSKTMIDLRNGKIKLDEDLKRSAEQKHELEMQIEGYELKHKLLEELIATLKSGTGNAQIQKVIEWQSKFEKVKLNEMRHVRLNDRLKIDNDHLRDLLKQIEIKVTHAEEMNMKFEREIEDRQLIWEHRELQLERKIEELEKQQSDIAVAAKRFEEAMGSYPDPSLPVSHQLEQALKIIHENIHLLMEAKIQHQLVEKKSTEHTEKVRDLENAILARDKVIQELRLRLPTTTILDTDKIVSDAMTRPDDYSRFHTVQAAQATIDSLQAIIGEKEKTIKKYQQLLQEAREELDRQTNLHQDEVETLNKKLKNKYDLDLIKLKTWDDAGSIGSHGMFSARESAKIRELEETRAVQENTIAHLNEKLREARGQAELWKGRMQKETQDYKNKEENSRKLMEKLEIEIRQLQDKLKNQEEEMSKFREELKNPKSGSAKDSPGAVSELRRQLAKREEERMNLVKSLAEIRRQMVEISAGNLQAITDAGRQEDSIQKLIKDQTAELQIRLDESERQNQTLRREISKQKTLIEQLTSQVKDGNDSTAKDKKVASLQQQLTKVSNELQRIKNERQIPSQRDETTEDLRRQIRSLEEKLRKTKIAERPLEDARDERSQRLIDSFKQQIIDLDTHKKELLKFNQQLKEELTKVRLRNEELQKINNYLKTENESLRNGESPRSTSSSGSSVRRIGESGKSNVELERIIASMKKRIDQLQADNRNLRSDLDRQRVTSDSNRAFFTQATESTKDIEQISLINARLQKEVTLLRERIAQLQIQAMPPPPSSSNGGY